MSQMTPLPLTSHAALFLDFDGTLVEMASTPSAIEMPDALPFLLRRTATMLNGALAVVTGRPIVSIDSFLPGAVAAIAGLHGAELRDSRGQLTRAELDLPAVKTARALLNDFKRERPEVLLEDKGLSLALHFRGAPHLGEECRTVIDLCVGKARGHLERLDGAFVSEIKPKNVSKARAIETFMKSAPFKGRSPIFAGDDVGDEAGFEYIAKINGIGIIVGGRSPTAATQRLRSVTALHQWLRTFVTGPNHD
ncbi:MAG: trehalose-phosphatase [Rhodospirillaceae bacterium]|nr:MAG: trehalose-phosphatase [Rhodospirillaceae bacterium]